MRTLNEILLTLLCYITFYLLFENLSHRTYFEHFYAPSKAPLYNNYNTFCPFLYNIRDFVSDLLKINTNSSTRTCIFAIKVNLKSLQSFDSSDSIDLL